jgi:uncharacterized protein YcfJ
MNTNTHGRTTTAWKMALAVAGMALGTQAGAQATFYENDHFEGRSFTTDRPVGNLDRFGFNDRASSVVVLGNRGDRWEVCEDRAFAGRCVVLRPGEYPSLAAMGLNNRVTSVRAVERNAQVEDQRYAPVPMPAETGQIALFEDEGFRGRTFTTDRPVTDFRSSGFNDRALSARITDGRWEVCDGVRFSGRCMVLRRGDYPSLAAMGLNDRVSSVRAVVRGARADEARPVPLPAPVAMAPVQLELYENDGFQGRTYVANMPMADLRGTGFNDRASSVVVSGARWEACEDANFGGRCVVLVPGRYPSLTAMGLNDRISSIRALPGGAPVADYRRRDNERLYEANITSVRAVLEQSGQRCWIQRDQIVQDRGNPNVPAALLGAAVGGILGHQVGGGTGRDLATGIGVIAGAAIGANAGRGDGTDQTSVQNVQRCTSVPSQARPAYWDVTYNFRGQEYRVQLATPPGATVTVNERGEPRA